MKETDFYKVLKNLRSVIKNINWLISFEQGEKII